MKKLLITLISFLLYLIYLVIGLRVGIALSFASYGAIAPQVSQIITGLPILFVVVYVLLLVLLILLGVYFFFKIDMVHLDLLLTEQFVKKSLLVLTAGLSFGFAYWIALQVFAITILLIRGIL